ncbi:hypothetical protein HGRIS_005744 [Hohenbuehelia grisea]|uniref:PH domain-containing protein n=1 Tax=Hohenbuehelia grisea TaxID=104357 RepID=A0ABR3JY11_9AGAR
MDTYESSSTEGAESLYPDTPNISKIFTDADLYKQIIEPGEPCNAYTGFDDFVGRDLNPAEQAMASRAVRLSATGESWLPDDQDAIYSEPESIDSNESSTLEDTEEDADNDKAPHAPVLHRLGTMDEDASWKLDPTQVMDLLVKEFDPLTRDGEEEQLILEADGALVLDVIVIGVIHVTTHRLAFHASLLSTRPDLHPHEQIIKAGPVVIHRKGMRPKRRVWVELSHDMLCTYASSKPEDRLRPLRTMLLSSVEEVAPFDAAHPTILRVKFKHDKTPKLRGFAEFDTEESARDWRRELNGAIFMYRNTRKHVLAGGDNDDETTGIRMSIPLERIANLHFRRTVPSLSQKACFQIQCLSENCDHPGNVNAEIPTIELTPFGQVEAWHNLADYITKAKRRRHGAAPGNVFVDFGILTPSSCGIDEGSPKPELKEQDDKERAIRAALALEAESDLWVVRARIYRSITSNGYFVVTPRYVGFWSKSFTQDDIRYRLAATTIQAVKPLDVKYVCAPGLALEIQGHRDLRFMFWSSTQRDEAIRRITEVTDAAAKRLGALTPASTKSEFSVPQILSSEPTEFARPTTPVKSASRTPGTLEHSPGRTTPQHSNSAIGIFAPLSRSVALAASVGLPNAVQLKLPKAINVPREVLTSHPPLHFVCLTIGSRGDVQPYIALGLGLKKEGHRVTIATHEEYKGWIEEFGIQHRSAGGDPGALMKLSVENKMFSPDFFKESLNNFRPWLDNLLVEAWEACKDADVLLESPSAMAGVHIAEALSIPYFRSFTMPWTKTAEFPHAFLSPPVDAPTFNSASYILFANVMWAATSGQINRWRRNTLHLKNTDMGHMAQSEITFIYNFSQAVVPKPLDWGDTTIISGYWFLDNPDPDWTAPADLLEFMAKARADQKPLVYIGFGSITVPDPNRVTSRIVRAVVQSDVRAIVSKGWSARMASTNDKPEPDIPQECYMLDKVPHDWLFPQVDAALHHGGAGTTGASLRAGIPTLIKPWFGDQFFWASRVQKLGAGLRVPSTHVNDLSKALTLATTSRVMKERASMVGQKIRSEDGVRTAIHTIYTYLPRASRIKAPSGDKDKCWPSATKA